MCCPVCRRASVDTEGAVTLSITPDTFIGTRRDVFNLQRSFFEATTEKRLLFFAHESIHYLVYQMLDNTQSEVAFALLPMEAHVLPSSTPLSTSLLTVRNENGDEVSVDLSAVPFVSCIYVNHVFYTRKYTQSAEALRYTFRQARFRVFSIHANITRNDVLKYIHYPTKEDTMMWYYSRDLEMEDMCANFEIGKLIFVEEFPVECMLWILLFCDVKTWLQFSLVSKQGMQIAENTIWKHMYHLIQLYRPDESNMTGKQHISYRKYCSEIFQYYYENKLSESIWDIEEANVTKYDLVKLMSPAQHDFTKGDWDSDEDYM